MKNNPLAKLSIQQLKRALEIRQAIADLEKKLGQFLGEEPTAARPAQPSRTRKMSAAARARISVAQTARWAERKKAATPRKALPRKKGEISAAGRARITAGTKARWARYNAEKRKKAAASLRRLGQDPARSW
jgi:hypothetical protein